MKKFNSKWDAIAVLNRLGKGERIQIDGRAARIAFVGGQKAIRYEKDTSKEIRRPKFTRTSTGWAR